MGSYSLKRVKVPLHRTILFASGVSLLAGLLFAAGCATNPKINWDGRVGHFSFDQAVREMGPPDKSARLQDGSQVAEWLTQRGFSRGVVRSTSGTWVEQYYEPPMPDRYLRLTFGPDGTLQAWKRVVK